MSLLGNFHPTLNEDVAAVALGELDIFIIDWSRKYGDFLVDICDDLQSARGRADDYRRDMLGGGRS